VPSGTIQPSARRTPIGLSQRLGRPSRPVNARRRFRLGFEALEDRLIPATLFTVNSLADNDVPDGVLTLRETLRVQQGLLSSSRLTSLEYAGTAAARQVLQALADRGPATPRGRVAKAALKRLANQQP
jgi:hypothetical protein